MQTRLALSGNMRNVIRYRLNVKRKRPRCVSNVTFIYAGNDLLSHTLGACSTIGPAGLNFRVRYGNGWNPRGKITDNLRRWRGV